MATIIGTILGGRGDASTAVIRCERVTSATPTSGGVIGSSVVMVAASTLADTGVSLSAGRWLLNWPDGPKVNRLLIDVPAGTGTHDIWDINVEAGAPSRVEDDYALFVTLAEAQLVVIAGRRVDILQDGNTIPAPGFFVRNPDYDGPLDGVNGFADFAGTKFQRVQRQ